jgi:hypothetical protein
MIYRAKYKFVVAVVGVVVVVVVLLLFMHFVWCAVLIVWFHML